MKRLFFLIVCFLQAASFATQAQHSVARRWNELLLEAIRNDFARPTVHARNLFHVSAAMYDAWAVYDPTAETFFLNRKVGDFYFPFDGVEAPENIRLAQEKAISYAAYRLIRHRFANSPGSDVILLSANNLLQTLGYSPSEANTDYTSGDPAALGNYLAEQVIQFGLQDGSNEQGGYANLYYAPVNEPLNPFGPGNSNIANPNRWQSLQLGAFIDQSGNPIPDSIIPFLGPEWGNVVPFSMRANDLTIYGRDDHSYKVYHDPGPPVYCNTPDQAQTDAYVWNFSLVAAWSSHLDAGDGVEWDISPNSIGNVDFDGLPKNVEDYSKFYNLLNGGDASRGYKLNPVTGIAYEPQIVPRGDYVRVLAEFWADGPASETPPGHWFTLLNYVNDHPQSVRKMGGAGEELDDLEWDVKAYFMLGGAMHDVAVAVWGIKGWYDYIRPVSAIRYLAGLGQSSDPALPNYDPDGYKLYDGYIELVKAGDPLAVESSSNINKIKIKAWKGPSYVANPSIDEAGVGWILAENWWPYQRPTFVTPPFAGYVSGHSTFSRAAAELLTLLTGSEYFPGGLGEFVAKKNQFLVFEEGPSVDVKLQWARYQDASDQCSLSRIWGGIHPPIDDLRGRVIGKEIGMEAFEFAGSFFDGIRTGVAEELVADLVTVFPNPAREHGSVNLIINKSVQQGSLSLLNVEGRVLAVQPLERHAKGEMIEIGLSGLGKGMYLLQLSTNKSAETHRIIVE